MIGTKPRWAGAVVLVLLAVAACTAGPGGTDEADDDSPQPKPLPGAPEGSATGGFRHVVIDPAPPSGDGCCLDVLAVGDIDGDGRSDLALGSEGGAGAFWYRNPDWNRFPIGDGDFTTDGRLVDVDGDGWLDFVVSDIAADEIVWWQNPGEPGAANGDAAVWARHRIGDGWAHDLVAGDLDGDGADDVAVFTKSGQHRVSWYRQPDDPTGEWPREDLVPSASGEGLAVGDADADGDLDLVASHQLLRNGDGHGGEWQRVDLAPADWGAEVRPAIADLDGDGINDVALAPAESFTGPIVWLPGPELTEHRTVDPDDVVGNHTLEAGDLDGDGRVDLVAGEMADRGGRVLAYLNRDDGFERVVLAETGTHNARLADLDGDGVVDVIGKNYTGPKQLEAWLGGPAPPGRGAWTYLQLDDDRARFEDRVPYFGLAAGDVDGDGATDLASGRYVYLNPGAPDAAWERVTLPEDADAMWVFDVDGNGRDDVVAQALPEVYWFEPDETATSWTAHLVADALAPTEHVQSQGYGRAEIAGRRALVMTTGEGIWYLEVPDEAASPWPARQLTDAATTEDLLALGDIDGDGCTDAVGSTGRSGHDLVWFANPCDGSERWESFTLGATDDWADRSALADVNADGRLDLVVADENGAGQGAGTFWFEAPPDPTTPWTRHEVARQGSTNAMSVADLNDDGLVDIVTGEHRGELRVTVWTNVGGGEEWAPEVVDSGKESHLGARVVTLDEAGAQAIVSIAFDDHSTMHLWTRRGAEAS